MAKKTYTLDEVEAMDREFLTPEIVAGVIGCDPYSINVQVKTDPTRLGFPASMCGTRVLIPKAGFLRFCRGVRETVIRNETVVHHETEVKLKLVRPTKQRYAARKAKAKARAAEPVAAPEPVEAAG